MTIIRAILYGGLAVGVLDLVDAFVFFGLRSGARPMGILHSIAAGFLGRDAAGPAGCRRRVGVLLHFRRVHHRRDLRPRKPQPFRC